VVSRAVEAVRRSMTRTRLNETPAAA